jgi:ribonuclease VapC
LILDSSAIVCVVEEEDGHDSLFEALAAAPSVGVGTPTLFETAIILMARDGAAGRVTLSRFVEDHEIAPIPFGVRHAALAADAFIRYGKGRHPARLNYGDCMTYATARLAEDPLLCIGDDFARTDLQLALN